MSVAWATIDPDSLEQIVATFLSFEHGRRVARTSPGQGDQGIDIQLEQPDGRLLVWQVKRYGSRMSNHWGKVKDSLETVNRHFGNRIEKWFLAAPINPTQAELTRFRDLTGDMPFPCEWLTQVTFDKWASDHPDTVAYFTNSTAVQLDQRRARDLNTILGVMELNQRESPLVRPSEAIEVISTVAATADHDPHFETEYATLRRRPSMDRLRNPDAAATVAHWNGTDGSVISFLERYEGAAAASGRLGIRSLRASGPNADEFAKYLDFGLPASGVVADEFIIDMPDSPHDLSGATLNLTSPPHLLRDSDLPWPATLSLLNEDGSVASSLLISIDERAVGLRGATLIGRDQHRLITVFNAARPKEDGSSQVVGILRVGFNVIASLGKPAADVIDAARFVTGIDAAASVELRQLSSGVLLGTARPGSPSLQAEDRLDWTAVKTLAEGLLALEPITVAAGQTLVVPREINGRLVEAVRKAGVLANGGTLARSWDGATLVDTSEAIDHLLAHPGEPLEMASEELVTIGSVTVVVPVRHTLHSVAAAGPATPVEGRPDQVSCPIAPHESDLVTSALLEIPPWNAHGDADDVGAGQLDQRGTHSVPVEAADARPDPM
jgi:hypothetical protein